MKTEGLNREEIIARIADFHGHLGPCVLFGFRAGQLALRELEAKGYFDLEADVFCGTRPPLSCFADGVQLGSGCTAGKGNLRFATSDSGKLEAVVIFRRRAASGPVGGLAASTVTIRIKPEIEALAAKWLAEVGDIDTARRQLALGDEEVFLVERSSGAWPHQTPGGSR